MSKSTVDKLIEWEKFIAENCGYDDSVIDWKAINGEYKSEKDEQRKQLLDLILWKSDHIDALENAKKTFLKYKETNDVNKAFEYIFKKLIQQVRYIPEAQEAMLKINEEAMKSYEKVLELCLIRDKKALVKLQDDLKEFDKNKKHD